MFAHVRHPALCGLAFAFDTGNGQQRQSTQQIHGRVVRVLLKQSLARAVGLPSGQGAARVVAGHQHEGRHMLRTQGVPNEQGLGWLASACQTLSGQQLRAWCFGRGSAGLLQGLVARLGVTSGIGFQGQLAVVMRDPRGKTARGGAFKFDSHFGGLGPVVRALKNRQQGQLRLAVKSSAVQRAPGFFGAVKEPCLHEVLRQGELRAVAVDAAQIGALQKVLVHAHRALKFAATAEQVAQREVQLRCVRVVLYGFDEGVDGFVLLLIEQEVQTMKVGPRRVALAASKLANVKPGSQPAQGEGCGQPDEQPLVVEVHRDGDRLQLARRGLHRRTG